MTYEFDLNRKRGESKAGGFGVLTITADSAYDAFGTANSYFNPTAYGPGKWTEIGQASRGKRCFYWERDNAPVNPNFETRADELRDHAEDLMGDF